MAKWRAVVLVPKVIDLEYATDIETAMRSAMNVMKSLPTVDTHIPKLLELWGPSGEIKAFEEKMKAERGEGEPVDQAPPPSDGPSAA